MNSNESQYQRFDFPHRVTGFLFGTDDAETWHAGMISNEYSMKHIHQNIAASGDRCQPHMRQYVTVTTKTMRRE